MKTILKYITLLIIGGVIIPLYLDAPGIKHQYPCKCGVEAPVEKPVKRNRGMRFYFLPDGIAKLLPVADFFK